MNEQQPDEEDLRMARQFMANPAQLETALAKITSVTGEKVPSNADERTVAFAPKLAKGEIASLSGGG